MRRFLDFISREEDLSDHSVFRDESASPSVQGDAVLEGEHQNLTPTHPPAAPLRISPNHDYMLPTTPSRKPQTHRQTPSHLSHLDLTVHNSAPLSTTECHTAAQLSNSPQSTPFEAPDKSVNTHIQLLTQLPSDDTHANFRSHNPYSALLNTESETSSPTTSQTVNAHNGFRVVMYPDESTKVAESAEQMRSLSFESRLIKSAELLSHFAEQDICKPRVDTHTLISPHDIENALKDLVEVMVWADKHELALWDLFLEVRVMSLLVKSLQKTLSFQIAKMAKSSSANHDNNGNHDHDDEDDDSDHIHINKNALQHNISPSSSTSQNHEDAIQKQLVKVENTSVEHRQTGNVENGIAQIYSEFGIVNATTQLKKGQTNVQANLTGFVASEIQFRILQTVSIMVQSVTQRSSLLCMFGANHINDILSFPLSFNDEEMIESFISTVRTITIRLDADLLQLFFDPSRNFFPLYDAVTQFFDYPESMVRIAVRNITLSIYAIGDPEVLSYAARDEKHYFRKTIQFLSKICGTVARAFELLLDDGREVARTRSRTGIFRRKVRISDVTDRLEEIENLCFYLNDIATVSEKTLRPLIVRLIATRFFAPFFRPLASLASPNAVRMRNRRWQLANENTGATLNSALPLFDAAARCLLLACMLTHFRTSPIGESLMRELKRPAIDFDHRNILHALKAMISDVTGTERVTFVSLCAVEAFICCRWTDSNILRECKYDFGLDNTDGGQLELISGEGTYPLESQNLERFDPGRSLEEPMLMSLSKFEAPLTPSNSLPSTPNVRLCTSEGNVTTALLSRATSTLSLSSDVVLGPVETKDDHRILSLFELGEAPLKEVLSSIALVVRRREVRTMRVLYSCSRVISAVGMTAHDYAMCIDVSKFILDELSRLMQLVLRDKSTTIVSIERMFESFRTAASSNQIMYSEAPKLKDILSADRVPLFASMFAKGAGKRRRASYNDATPPIEIEDANTFFVMLYAYERSLTYAGRTITRKLTLQSRTILLEFELGDSYLEKRDALESLADAVLEHGISE